MLRREKVQAVDAVTLCYVRLERFKPQWKVTVNDICTTKQEVEVQPNVAHASQILSQVLLKITRNCRMKISLKIAFLSCAVV